MPISYQETHDLPADALEKLFLSVGWESGKYPEKLSKAMRGYETVYAAWENETLVGLVCAMDDGVMTAYVHYLLVEPRLQGQGIGRRLMELVKEKYRDYLRINLLAYRDGVGFYHACGFREEEDSAAMSLNRF